MKLTCKRENFFQLFSLAASVASKRDVKVVLQNVKMTADQNIVVLTATDMFQAIRLEMTDAVIEEPGETILPTARFLRILKESNDEMLVIESEGTSLKVSGENKWYDLPTFPSDEFPEIPPFSADAWHEAPGKTVREIVRRTKFAIDTENTKYTLGGVLFEFTEGRIAAVATDGRRLANQEGTAAAYGGHVSENTAIVPLKALSLIERGMVSEEEPVKIAVKGGKIYFGSGTSTLSSSLVEGRFPRWKNIIPEKEGRVQVDIMASYFLQAVRQAEIMSSEKQPGIYLNFSAGKMELTASGAEVGQSKIELPISYEAAPLRLKMDPRYLTDFLSGLDNEAIVSFYMKGEQSVLFQTGDGYNYVVMPLT